MEKTLEGTPHMTGRAASNSLLKKLRRAIYRLEKRPLFRRAIIKSQEIPA